MNSKEPAVKALKAMYTAQFSTEMPFTSDKRAEEAKKKAEEEAQKILEQKGEQAKESLKVELDKLVGEIKDSAEYKDLAAQYPEDMQKDIDVHGTVLRAVPRQAGGAIIVVAELSMTFTGVLYSSVPIAYSNRFEIDPDDPSTFAGLLDALRREAKVLIQRMSKASMPMLFALRNYEMFVKKHPEHELLNKDITLGYFNGKNRKVAWTRVVEMRFSYLDADGQTC